MSATDIAMRSNDALRISQDGRIVEMIELPDHPWFVATRPIKTTQ